MRKVISFSLWGDRPIYLAGAIRNAELCPQIYPGWIPRFYVATDVPPDVLRRLAALGAEVIQSREPGDWRGLMWRFAAAADPAVEVMLSRDCDSRLSRREAAAVDRWTNSAAPFHIMRDHPLHNAAILGGMWGAKSPVLRDLPELIRQHPREDRWQTDQDFLHDIIFPRVKHTAMVHDEFFEGSPFPVRRRGLEFVGQVYDENNQASRSHQWTLAKGILVRTWRSLRKSTR